MRSDRLFSKLKSVVRRAGVFFLIGCFMGCGGTFKKCEDNDDCLYLLPTKQVNLSNLDYSIRSTVEEANITSIGFMGISRDDTLLLFGKVLEQGDGTQRFRIMCIGSHYVNKNEEGKISKLNNFSDDPSRLYKVSLAEPSEDGNQSVMFIIDLKEEHCPTFCTIMERLKFQLAEDIATLGLSRATKDAKKTKRLHMDQSFPASKSF